MKISVTTNKECPQLTMFSNVENVMKIIHKSSMTSFSLYCKLMPLTLSSTKLTNSEQVKSTHGGTIRTRANEWIIAFE